MVWFGTTSNFVVMDQIECTNYSYLNLPLQVDSRYHDPQLQVGENTHIFKSSCLNTHYILNNGDLIG